MKNRKIKRFLALLLAGATISSAVALAAGAANYTGDVDGDGVITAFDAQVLAEYRAGKRQLTPERVEAVGSHVVADIVNFLLGKDTTGIGDEYIPGKVSVYNAQDLALMQQFPDREYTLMRDIDMKGAVWSPVVGFSGSFDGNGHTISNVVIEDAERMNIGFFGDVKTGAVVKNLALRNAVLNAGGDNKYIGLIAGTTRGTITGFTVTGAIYDDRTVMDNDENAGESIVVGAMFGRTMADSGEHTGGKSITVTDDTGKHSVSGLCGDIKLYIQKGSENVVHKGLCGFKNGSGGKVSGQWRDSTNCADNESEVMLARQDTVVNYMNAMATVPWQVPEVLTYNNEYPTGEHKQVYYPGTTYYGLPYTHRNGGMERFLACAQSKDANGVYMMQTGLGDSTIAVTPMTGFATMMGNDCSSAVGWAWMQISPNRVNGASETECAGGAYVVSTQTMVPTNQVVKGQYTDEKGNLGYNYTYINADDEVATVRMFLVDGKLYHEDKATKQYVLGDPNGNEVSLDDPNLTPRMVNMVSNNQSTYGVFPVGNWTTNTYLDDKGFARCDDIVGDFAYSVPAYEEGSEAASTADFLLCNTDQQMAEAYALTRRADGLVGASPTGHGRLVTSYPMTIRNADGTINLNKSFLVCTEQGEGYFDFKDLIEPKQGAQASYSNWRVDYRFTYYNLLCKDDDGRLGAEDGNPASVGARYSKEVYIPITIRALRSEYVKHGYIDEVVAVSTPYTGRIYSNWRIVSTKVSILTGAGIELFSKTVYTGLAESGDEDYNHSSGQYVTLDRHYTDWFKETAAEKLRAGRAYYYRVEVMLSNGDVLIVSRDSNKVSQNGHSGGDCDQFIYNP